MARLTAQEKRDREYMAILDIALRDLEEKHEQQLINENNAHFSLGLEQGWRDAEASYKAQSFIDRLLGKSL